MIFDTKKCKWRTVVSQTDYRVEWGLEVVINDTRNLERFPLTIGQLRDFFHKFPSRNSDELLINYCINQAIIPHPVDELF